MRRIVCKQCAARVGRESYPGEQQRVVAGKARQPQAAQRVITVNATGYPLNPSFYDCDNCNASISPGDDCAAWTVWLEGTQEPPAWESEYLEATGGDHGTKV